MSEDIITMSRREWGRYQLIERSLKKEITQARAAELLELSERHIRRLVRKVRLRGMRGLVHGNRGRPSPRRMGSEMVDRIASIIGQQYRDFTPLHATEKLWERHKVRVSREKVRLIMMARGLWRRRRRRKEDHVWRERKPHPGEMVQLDGSHHAWLEERGPRLVLMGYVDDATGRFFGRFYDHEGVYPAMDSLRGGISSALGFPRQFIWINTALTRPLGSRRLRNCFGMSKPRRSSRGRLRSWG